MSITWLAVAYLTLGIAFAGWAEMYKSSADVGGDGLSPWMFLLAILLWPALAFCGALASLEYLFLMAAYYPIKFVRHTRKSRAKRRAPK